jgi:murein DD-endopeptidase MepM/ murein hydrolase activator NlpD
MSEKIERKTSRMGLPSFQLKTIPKRIYKESDHVWPNEEHDLIKAISDTESWSFYLVVTQGNKPVHPISAKIELISNESVVKTFLLTNSYLEHVSRGLPEQKVDLLVWNHFSEPKELRINKLRYTLQIEDNNGAQFENTLEIALERYKQKAKLIFPLKGRFIIAGGHEYNEPHRWERSQFYAYDIFPTGPKGELMRRKGLSNEDWWGYGTPVIAPADGVVVHARNDIPENDKPGILPDLAFYKQFPDWLNAAAGNNVIIDHGYGEYSFLAHLQHGSVAVRKDEKVQKGQQIGRVGNSGNSDAPHLHFHLMDGPEIFRCDGLPSHFENLELLGLEGKVTSPKRGLFLIAK